MVRNKLKNKKGLTLIELLAVIVILGIIAAIATPAIMDAVNDSKAKSFSEELNTLQTLSQQYNVKSTTLDYVKLGKTATVPIDRTLVEAAFKSKNLPQKSNLTYAAGTTHVNVWVTGTTTGGKTTYKGQFGLTETQPAAGTGEISVHLAEQLGKVYLSGATATETAKVQAYPIDIELLYMSGQISNKLRFPVDVPTGQGYGNAYQNQSSATLSSLKFPKENTNTPGNFFVTDNGTVFYSGTDASFDNGSKAVHVAGGGSK